MDSIAYDTVINANRVRKINVLSNYPYNYKIVCYRLVWGTRFEPWLTRTASFLCTALYAGVVGQPINAGECGLEGAGPSFDTVGVSVLKYRLAGTGIRQRSL